MAKIINMSLMLLFAAVGLSENISNRDLSVTSANRYVDITSQIVKTNLNFTLLNTRQIAASFFIFAVEPEVKNQTFFLSSSTSDGKVMLQVAALEVKPNDNTTLWRINLPDKLQPGKKITINVKTYASGILTPFPTFITQKEKQLVLYEGNTYIYSPYKIKEQTTTINVGTNNVESYTKFKPVSQNNFRLVYGPYNNVKPYSVESVVVHYENNAHFLTVTELERVLQVSHWGNIAVEETVSLQHKGAIFKGSFSRYEYHQNAQSGPASVKSFKTILPAAAKDVYYRDEIGNISTSNLRTYSDSMELNLRPRFPIFGGWKTKYTIGYNIPSYEYLFNSGANFVFKMRVFDHIYDEQVIEHLITKIILPESASNVMLKIPNSAVRQPDEKHFTYLDTIGRTVVVIQSKNLLENHIEDFELSYEFPMIYMLQKPFLVVICIFLLLILVIIYVRLDLSLTKPSFKKNN